MARYTIFDHRGEPVNTIMATAEYMNEAYPDGNYQMLPDPVQTAAAPQRLTVLQFRNRFTMEEKAAIYTAADQSVAVKIWLDDLAAASWVELSDSAIIEGVNGLVQAGILSEARADEILA